MEERMKCKVHTGKCPGQGYLFHSDIVPWDSVCPTSPIKKHHFHQYLQPRAHQCCWCGGTSDEGFKADWHVPCHSDEFERMLKP